VCGYVRKRERDRVCGCVCGKESENACVCVYVRKRERRVCVCVCEKERQNACVCVYVTKKERKRVCPFISRINTHRSRRTTMETKILTWRSGDVTMVCHEPQMDLTKRQGTTTRELHTKGSRKIPHSQYIQPFPRIPSAPISHIHPLPSSPRRPVHVTARTIGVAYVFMFSRRRYKVACAYVFMFSRRRYAVTCAYLYFVL